jgi:hypothetical protein
MKMFARHLLIRTRMLATEPASLGILALAGLSSIVIWPWVGIRPEMDIPGIGEFVMFCSLLLWPFLVGVVAVGRTAGGQGNGSGPLASDLALPALPIGHRMRILADTLAVLAFSLIFRLPGLLLGELGRDFVAGPGTAGDAAAYRFLFLEQTLQGSLLFLPMLIAWSTPSRSHVFYLVRPVLVSMPLFALIWLEFSRNPAVAAGACLVLCCATLLTAGWNPESRRRPASAHTRRRLYRPGLDPEARLRRDRWVQPLRAGRYYLLAIALAETAVILLELYAGTPVTARAMVAGMAVGFLMSVALFRPLGLQLLRPAHSPSDTATGGTTLAHACSLLPVRPEAVVRGVYLHALLGGGAIVALVLAHTGLMRILDLEEHSSLLLVRPLAFAVPAAAGLAVSMAVGDRLRTGISLAAVIALLPVHIALWITLSSAGMSPREPGAGMAVDLVVLAALALIGGLPPLIHLRKGAGRV